MRLFLAVLIGCVFGSVFGHTLGSFQRDEVNVPGRAAESRVTDGAAETHEAVAPVTEAPPDSAPLAGLEERIRAATAKPLSPTTGRLGGMVRLVDGTPLAGVQIAATPQSVGLDLAPLAKVDSDLDGYLATHAELHHRRRAWMRKAVTDGAGAYEIRDAAPVSYWLAATLDGYRIESDAEHWVEPDATVDFVARPAGQVEFQVLMPDGSLGAGAIIRATTTLGHGSSIIEDRWAPGQPAWYLAEGSYSAFATMGDGLKSKPVDFVVSAGQPTQTIALQLDRSSGVKGKLYFPTEEEIGHANVWVVPAAMAATTGRELDRQRTNDRREFVSPSSPRFRFVDLEPGAYVVYAGRNEIAQCSVDVDVGDGVADVELTLPPAEKGLGVVLWAHAPDGALLETVKVTVRYVEVGSSSGHSSSFPRRRDGSYWIDFDAYEEIRTALGSAEGKLPAGARIELEVEHSTYGMTVVPYAPGAESVRAHFVEAAHLQVTVSGVASNRLEDRIMVQLAEVLPEVDTEWRVRSVPHSDHRTSALAGDGQVELGPVAPGDYALQVLYAGGGTQRWNPHIVIEQRVTLAAGPNRVAAAVPPLYAIEIRFAENVKARHWNLEPLGGDHPGHWIGGAPKEGDVARFEGLLAGRYRLDVHSESGRERMFVEVPAGGELTFEPMAANCYQVSVWKDGLFRELRLADGDLLIGIGEVDFTSETQADALFDRALAEESMVLRFLRSGQTFEVTVDGQRLAERMRWGGRLSPAAR